MTVLLFLLAVTPYWVCREGGLVFDDPGVANQANVRLGRWKRFLRYRFRPLTWISYSCFGPTQWADCIQHPVKKDGNGKGLCTCWKLRKTLWAAHGVNTLLHGFSTLFAYGFFSKVFTDEWSAVWSAALVAVFPLAAESVSYISGRANVLAWTFGYLGLLCSACGFWVPAVVCFTLAVLSKEEAVTLFPIAGLLGWHYGWAQWWIYPVAPLAVFFAGTLLTSHVLRRPLQSIKDLIGAQSVGMVAMGFPEQVKWPLYPLASFTDHALHLSCWVFGQRMCFLPKWGAPRWQRIVLALGIVAVWILIAPIPFAWAALLCAPFILVPMSDRLLAARYYGLGGAFALMAAPVLASINPYVAGVAVAWMAILAIDRARAFVSNRTFWEQVLRDNGRGDFALINIANHAISENKPEEAEKLLKQACFEYPNAALAFFNLAFIESFRNLDLAIAMAEDVMSRFPDLAHGWDRLGAWHFKAGHFLKARRAWKKCLNIKPMASAYNGMGLREVNRQCWGLARDAFQLAVETNPAHVPYRWNLAHIEGILGNQGAKVRILQECPRELLVSDDMVLVQESKP